MDRGPGQRSAPAEGTRPAGVDDALLAQLVDHAPDAVIIADTAGTITYWNHAAQRIFGWTTDQAVGETLDLIIPERLRARHWTGYSRTMATGHTSYGERLLEVPALHRDGHRISVAFTVTLLYGGGDNRPVAIAAVLRDDTERWTETRSLQAELARLRARPSGPPEPGTDHAPHR